MHRAPPACAPPQQGHRIRSLPLNKRHEKQSGPRITPYRSPHKLGNNLGTKPAKNQLEPCATTQEKARRINYMLDFCETLDLAILVRVQASQPKSLRHCT